MKNRSGGKTTLLTVRMRDETYAEFMTAVEMKGATASSLIHQYAVQLIIEEKRRDPGEFARVSLAIRERIAARSEAKKSRAQSSDQDADNPATGYRAQNNHRAE